MLWIPIDRGAGLPLKRQVYGYIRKQILQGRLKAGEKLPATRELASQLGISRNVIIEAYEQLLAEGYIEARQGAGTFVSSGACLEPEHIEKSTEPFVVSTENQKEKKTIDFRSGVPALNLFPRRGWGKFVKEVCLEAPDNIFGYGQPEGRAELRKALSTYLKRTRGVKCHSDQIVITSGATQAFSLIAKMLLSHGAQVIIEDPITHEIQTIFTAAEATLCPVPVDEQGMKTDLLSYGLNQALFL